MTLYPCIILTKMFSCTFGGVKIDSRARGIDLCSLLQLILHTELIQT